MEITRRFIIGDKWLYFKIYASNWIQNKLLMNEIYQVVFLLYQQDLIEKFFFIRYVDNDGGHLRLRFYLKNEQNTGEIIGLLNSALKQQIKDRTLSKITVDTYLREMERYGAENIEDVETVFSVNSWMNLNLLHHFSNHIDDVWLGSIKLVDNILNDLSFSTLEKHLICESSYKSSLNMLGDNKFVRDRLKGKYRENSKKIIQLFQSNIEFNDFATPSQVNAKFQLEAIKKISNRSPSKSLSFDDILKSIIHMNYNRTFLSNQNTFELLIYYMMSNYYKSKSILEMM